MLPGLPELPRQERPMGDGPIAAFTVGRVRANKLLPFFVTAGAAERDAANHPGFIEGITILRPPLVIGTFSLWRSGADMRDYAVGTYPGGHSKAIAKDSKAQYNHEMFFSRHLPYAPEGQWKGRNPLEMLVASPNGRAHAIDREDVRGAVSVAGAESGWDG